MQEDNWRTNGQRQGMKGKISRKTKNKKQKGVTSSLSNDCNLKINPNYSVNYSHDVCERSH